MVGTFTNKVYVTEMGSTILKMPTLIRVTEDVYDLNGNGSKQRLFLMLNQTIRLFAAEGIYARKYIAKNDGLSDASIVTYVNQSETFSYKLTIKK